jgi:beta-N-acetylhexosaminidase
MSKFIIQDLLKGELGYKGLVITDDMAMYAITKNYPLKEAAAQSIIAGADVIIIKLFSSEAYDGVLAAVQAGDISQARLNESAQKILELKLKRGIIK